MREIFDLIKKWIAEKKCGQITINFFKGGVANFSTKETHLPGKTTDKAQKSK